MVGDQVCLPRHDVKRHLLVIVDLVMPAQGLNALLIPVASLECAVDDRSLPHGVVMVFPAHGDVQPQIQGPEGLEAFGLSPNVDQHRHRYHVIHQLELHRPNSAYPAPTSSWWLRPVMMRSLPGATPARSAKG